MDRNRLPEALEKLDGPRPTRSHPSQSPSKQPKVLLVGQYANSFLSTAHSLKLWGAHCQSAASCQAACNLLRKEAFDVVIAELNLADGSARRLTPLLRGSLGSLFCAYPVEDSCLWIP